MSNIVISVEHLSKSYRLGQINTGTFANDLKIWWAKTRGKSNPLLRIGETDHGNRDGEELWALRNISFKVEKGEVLGIIGKNGAGKSTLLKILSRVTAPTSGEIKVKGRIASLLEVGTGFHPELTGRENIYLNGAILGMSHDEIASKFNEIVDFSEIEKFIDTPVKRYSSGMYVRLAFAVAAHLEPEILVVDEVLAVGDVEFQKKCLGKMGDVAQEGRTVLFVSHNLESIKYLGTRAILLNYGKIEEEGDVEYVVNTYSSAFTYTQEDIDRFPVMNSQMRIGFEYCHINLITNPHSDSSELNIRTGVISENPHRAVGIVFGLSTMMGTKVVKYGAKLTNFEFDIDPGVNHFIIICKNINHILAKGEYIVNLWLVLPGIIQLVSLENAGIINIPGSNFFGTGNHPEVKAHGPVLMPIQIKRTN